MPVWRSGLKSKVNHFADNRKHKYSIYVERNPDLAKSPQIDVYHPIARDIINFCLGYHYLPMRQEDGG